MLKCLLTFSLAEIVSVTAVLAILKRNSIKSHLFKVPPRIACPGLRLDYIN